MLPVPDREGDTRASRSCHAGDVRDPCWAAGRPEDLGPGLRMGQCESVPRGAVPQLRHHGVLKLQDAEGVHRIASSDEGSQESGSRHGRRGHARFSPQGLRPGREHRAV